MVTSENSIKVLKTTCEQFHKSLNFPGLIVFLEQNYNNCIFFLQNLRSHDKHWFLHLFKTIFSQTRRRVKPFCQWTLFEKLQFLGEIYTFRNKCITIIKLFVNNYSFFQLIYCEFSFFRWHKTVCCSYSYWQNRRPKWRYEECLQIQMCP